jgi:hypothetical protein
LDNSEEIARLKVGLVFIRIFTLYSNRFLLYTKEKVYICAVNISEKGKQYIGYIPSTLSLDYFNHRCILDQGRELCVSWSLTNTLTIWDTHSNEELKDFLSLKAGKCSKILHYVDDNNYNCILVAIGHNIISINLSVTIANEKDLITTKYSNSHEILDFCIVSNGKILFKFDVNGEVIKILD